MIVHAGQIRKTTKPALPTEEEWMQATSEDHDLGYIQKILFSAEEKPMTLNK